MQVLFQRPNLLQMRMPQIVWVCECSALCQGLTCTSQSRTTA